jgi:phosphatidylglycerophosphate synthase
VDERIVEGDSVFVMATSVYPWMVVVILARELLVTGIRGLVEGEGVAFKTSWSGKAKMILQSIIVPIVLCLVINFNPAENAWADWLCMGLVYLTVVVTVWSGVPYVMGLRAMVRQKRADAEGASKT